MAVISYTLITDGSHAAPRATPLGRLGGLGKAPHQLLQGALNTLEPLLDCRAQRHSGAVVKDGELQDTSLKEPSLLLQALGAAPNSVTSTLSPPCLIQETGKFKALL